MSTSLESLQAWVNEVASLTQPDAIQWCDGSDEQQQALIELMQSDGTLKALNPETHPNCYLHHSDPQDVAHRYNLARAYEVTGRPERAAEQRRIAQSLESR